MPLSDANEKGVLDWECKQQWEERYCEVAQEGRYGTSFDFPVTQMEIVFSDYLNECLALEIQTGINEMEGEVEYDIKKITSYSPAGQHQSRAYVDENGVRDEVAQAEDYEKFVEMTVRYGFTILTPEDEE